MPRKMQIQYLRAICRTLSRGEQRTCGFDMLNEECGIQRELSCRCYGLTPAEIALLWQTTPPRMPLPPSGT